MAAPRTDARFDTVVIGAGLAGLNAARHLRRAGRRVAVLEARREVGGRTRTRELEGVVADFGGEWIGPAHRRMRRLVDELGLTIEPARNLGHPVLWRLPEGERIGRLPPIGAWLGGGRTLIGAAAVARGVEQDRPWAAARARELDRLSVASWLDRRGVGGGVRHLLERLLGSLGCGGLDRLSLLQLAWWLRHGGGPLRALLTTFQWRISEGAQEVSQRIASELDDAVRLEAPVRRIVDGDAGVVVETAGHEPFTARRAIVAIPVSHVEEIEFEPPLPESQRRLSALRIGAGSKIIALLPRGHDVRHNTVVGGQPLWTCWRRGGRVTGFAPSPDGDLPEEVLRDDLARAFGVGAADLRSPTVFRWADVEHIPGCDVAFAPGELCALGPALARSHGRVHFAGAERSSWPNNMEGALESGERAASEVARVLKSSGSRD